MTQAGGPVISLPKTKGGFRVILADPAWRFVTRSERGRDRCPDGVRVGAEDPRHYRTMTLDEIRSMPVAHVAAPDCALFLWATDPLLPAALDVGAAWGFTFKTVAFYWAKTDRAGEKFPMGNGYWTRANPEQCLLFTRGAPKRISASVRRLIIAPRREHSRKPDEVRASIKRLVPGPYLELFARESVRGWKSWGDQAQKFTGRGR